MALKRKKYASATLQSSDLSLGIRRIRSQSCDTIPIKKAFDAGSREILLKELIKYGINGVTLDWFTSYLKNRQQKLDTNGAISSTQTFNISVIQGSILAQSYS